MPESSTASDANASEVERKAAELFKQSYFNIIKEIAEADVKIVSGEMERTIEEKGIDAFLKRGFIPYAAASVILAFSGKEVNKDTVSKMVKALGISPNQELLREFETLNYRNHLLYINSIYLFLSIGAEPSEQGLMDAVAAMGIKPDEELAKYAMDLYRNDKSFEEWR